MTGNDAFGALFTPISSITLSMPQNISRRLSALPTMLATPRQARFAYRFIFVSALVFAALAPIAKVKLAQLVAFIPIDQSALILNDLLTSAVLLGFAKTSSSRRFLLLASGYLFTALMTVAHTLSFPGVFAPSGVIGGGIHTTAWLYVFWHAAFPLFVIAYVSLPERRIDGVTIVGSVLATVAVAGSLVALTTAGEAWLPPAFEQGRYSPYQPFMAASAWVSAAVAIVIVLLKRRRLVIENWLLIVLSTWIFEIALSALLNAGRYDVGFYAGRIYGLIASVTVLYMLLLDSTVLHHRLAVMTARIAIHRERTAAQRVLDAVLTQMPVGVVLRQRDCRELLVNQHAASILALPELAERWPSPHATVHMDIDSLPSDMAAVGSLIARAHRGEEFAEVEVCVPRGPEMRYLTASGRSVKDAHGSVVATVVLLTDVTEKKRAEVAAQLTHTRLRYLIDNTPLAVIEWGPQHVISSWSRRAAEFFGWTSDEILGTKLQCLPIIHEDDRHKVTELLHQVSDTNTKYLRTSMTHRTKQGELKNFEWYTSVLHDPDGHVTAVFSLILDITERIRAIDQLQDADRRKDMQIVTIAHELRNPLSPISHAAMLIGAGQLAPAKLTWAAELITRQARHMARLLDDLLDVTRISSGKIKIEAKRTDLLSVLHDALEMSKPLIARCGHTMTVSLPADPVYVHGDAMRLVQVFANLLTNAGKYTEPGGHIRVSLLRRGSDVAVQIEDNGLGIEADMLVQVFQPFVQVDRASHLSRGGLGIGLALARGIVDLHGGTLSVTSEGSGKGSIFTVLLPSSGPEPAAAQALLPSPAQLLDKP